MVGMKVREKEGVNFWYHQSLQSIFNFCFSDKTFQIVDRTTQGGGGGVHSYVNFFPQHPLPREVRFPSCAGRVYFAPVPFPLTLHFSDNSDIIDNREKKWALTENLQIHAKKLKKLLLNPEGCSYRRLCKQGNEGRKKRKIVNNKHLKVSKTYTYPSNDVTRALLKLIIWQAVVQMYPIL